MLLSPTLLPSPLPISSSISFRACSAISLTIASMAAPAVTFLFCILLLSHGSAQAKKVLSGSAVAAEDGSVSEKRFLGRLVDASASRRRRELGEARATARDVFAPVTNPVTVPSTNPASPGIVTVPLTNPGTGTGFATNPNLPPLYPEPTTPATMPDPTTMPSPVTTPAPFMNPVTAPTNPTAPVTNPATTPTPLPGTSPVTNPVTTYPYPQQGGGGAGGMPTAPVFPPPTTMPGTVQPAAPTVAGQTWCVAKEGLMETALQDGLDYACGIGGADCSALQPMGSCYNPNTLQAHASYAFNSYFQRNPSPASCDFGGAGMLVSTNPSSGTCMYQTSAGSGAGYSPAVTGNGAVGMTPAYGPLGSTTGTGPVVGAGSGSTVLNANNNPGGTSMYGPDNPTGFSGAAASLSCGWVLSLIWIFTFAYVKEKV